MPGSSGLVGNRLFASTFQFIFIQTVPMVYLILAMAAIQGGALSVEGAARQAARVFVQSPTTAAGTARARTAVDFALNDFGLDSAKSVVTIRCRPNPAACLTRRGFVTSPFAHPSRCRSFPPHSPCGRLPRSR